MKRNLFIIIIIIIANLYSNTSFTQNSSIILGLSGGTSFSNMNFTGDFLSTEEDIIRKTTFNGGIDFGFRYNSFSLISGVKYVQRGTKTKIERNDPNNPFVFSDNTADVGKYSTKSTSASISIPILLRYELGLGNMSFSLSLGPVFNKGIGDVVFTDEWDLTTFNIPSQEIKSSYGDKGDKIFKAGFSSFLISPAAHFKIGDNGKFNINIVYEVSRNAGNSNYLVQDAIGIRTVNGSIKHSRVGLTIGYEHHIDLTIGSKY